MGKLRHKDVFMEDVSFCHDLDIKRMKEEEEMFELIMDSVCDGKGKHLSKEQRERMSSKFKVECKLFKEHMESMRVKPLRKEK